MQKTDGLKNDLVFKKNTLKVLKTLIKSLKSPCLFACLKFCYNCFIGFI